MKLRSLKGLLFALAVALAGHFAPAQAQTARPFPDGKVFTTQAQSAIPFTFGKTCYIDFQDGNDTTGTGASMATAYKTLAKAVDVEYTQTGTGTAPKRATPISVLFVVAGSPAASDYAAGGDRIKIDAVADGRTTANPDASYTGYTAIGLRAHIPGLDPPRATTQSGRPILRSDIALSITSGAAWTNVSGTIYKSGNTVVGTPALISQVLYKPGVLTQLDADGAWKCHLKLTTGTGGDAAATTACATAWSAYYDTSTFRLYINNGTGSPTTADYGYVLGETGAAEAWAKVWVVGANVLAVEGVDILWGERAVVAFDCGSVYVGRVRATEQRTHSIICSYTNAPLKSITFEDVAAYGLGYSTVGGTMFAMAGESGGFSASGITMRRCLGVRYVLQNPAGSPYMVDGDGASYPIQFVGTGTSAVSNAGYLLPGGMVMEECIFTDVSAAKTKASYANPFLSNRHTTPTDRANLTTYPLIARRCVFNLIGGWFDECPTNSLVHTLALDNCQVTQKVDPDAMAAKFGFRTGVLFDPPAAGGGYYLGQFNGTTWTMDIGTGNSSNQAAVGVKTDSSTANFAFYTKVNSTLSVVSASAGVVRIFDYANSGTTAATKALSVYCRDGVTQVVYPAGHTGRLGYVTFQDTTSDGNAARTFINEGLYGMNFASTVSSQYGTLASWTASVDPQARVVGIPLRETGKEVVIDRPAPVPLRNRNQRHRKAVNAKKKSKAGMQCRGSAPGTPVMQQGRKASPPCR